MTELVDLSDTAARQTIREALDATLIVEAAAGTGKTTEMIARIIAALRTGAATLERIVAVTFTELAAGEMKLRLRTELERARVIAAAGSAERVRLDRAIAALEVARIGSIHSFCADLLRERPVEAGIDPLFEVAADDRAERLFNEAFDGWLVGCLAAPPEGVRRILRHKDPTELLRKAGWSLVDRRDFAGAWRRDPFDRTATLDAVVDELAAVAALASQATSRNDSLAIGLSKLERWLAELGRREQVRPRDHDGLEAELAAVAKWRDWQYTGKGRLFGPGLARADVVVQRDAALADLKRAIAAADADLAACLHTELQPLVAAYERLKARAGQLDFLDLLARTRDLLRDDARVRTEMQARFSHVFVDEFQDTDPLQVEILLLLCADDPAIADPAAVRVAPGKLFVVGDPKQAIYRFRRADLALYHAVKQRLIAGGATLVHLTTSFRGVPAIQSAVNAAFAPVMVGGEQATYIPLHGVRADRAGQPAVVALPVPSPYGKRDVTKQAIEASYPEAVAGFVDHLLRTSGWTVSERGEEVPIAARHVCLMFRRFQSFGNDLTRPYVRALEGRGIPHVLVGGRSFHDREEIETVRNALAAIEWPDDELAVYGTLRGPLFAIHDEDLIAFKHDHGRLSPLRWLADERRAELTIESARTVADALAILGALHVRRNRRPIADTLARLLATTRAHAGIALWPAGEQALANVARVLDLARRFEAGGATSFRAFVERLDDDAARGRHPEAPVVEAGTDGVRMMTVHAAKGLEFPVVVLCDPTAPLAQERPSRHIDIGRRVWLERIAGCEPIELAEHADEVLARDREEGERLTYVAVTRARDLLVVPVVGDEERDGWLASLWPVIYPPEAAKRTPQLAVGCPPFGDDSVVWRGLDTMRDAADSVAPGRHAPRAGAHDVVWWDPRALGVGREHIGGFRQRQILQAEGGGPAAAASEASHAAWQARRAGAIAAGSVPSLTVRTVTAAAREAGASGAVALERVDGSRDRAGRPRGKRFGSLVHAVLAAVDLRGDPAHVAAIARNHARLIGASPDELAAAITAVVAALAHPLLVRAAAAGELRREVPIVLAAPEGKIIEGIVDLAFTEAEGGWLVVDFKTDAELGDTLPIYEAQVRMYADAIAAATGAPAAAVLLVI